MMNKIRVQAKKSLGQNFLVNPHVLDRIVEAAQIKKSDTIIEVGPGTGALTERLVQTGAKIIAIEKDARLIGPLSEKFANNSNFSVTEGDILEIELQKMGAEPGYKIVANIPYYLTSHLLRLIFTKWPRAELAVLMVQEEVARRMMSAPPDMNLLALSVQLYAEPSIVARVSRNSFRPVPDVDSMVVCLKTKQANPVLNEKVMDLARKAFGQKRKQLSSTLPADVLGKAATNPKARPQHLSVEEWLELGRLYT